MLTCLRLLVLVLALTGALASPAHAARRSVEAIAGTAAGHYHRLPHKPGTWRPTWWPKGLAVGRPGVVIRLAQQRLYVQGRRGFQAFSVSTGARRPTPQGVFRIVEKLRRPAWTYKGQHVEGGIAGNPLGVCWMGLGMPRWWTGAPIGMHGTNAPWVIGHPASHGCIRLRNEDALALYRIVPVGAPVWIVE